MKPVPGLSIEQQPEGALFRILGWGEARGEQDAGGRLESVAMAACMWAAMNRVGRFGKSLRDAILWPWAFSIFNANDPNRVKLLDAPTLDPTSWERADTVADLIESRLLADPTHGADHYCTVALWNTPAKNPAKPQWYNRECIETSRTIERVRHGHHVFAYHRG